MTSKSFRVNFIACTLIVLLMVGCGPVVNTTVMLSRDHYVSQLNPEDYKSFAGKRILFNSITDKSTNTSNLYYYNPEQTLGYSLYYKNPGQTMAQPVVSFFWYALQKGFDHAGITIEESSPIYDAELTMTFLSVTDKEINFDVLLTKMGRKFYKKNYSVRSPDVQTNDVTILEKRAYVMIDSIVKTILDDPDFQIMLLGHVASGQRFYTGITGIVLNDGRIIQGQIISINNDVLKIRTKDGKVSSHSFMNDVQKYITK